MTSGGFSRAPGVDAPPSGRRADVDIRALKTPQAGTGLVDALAVAVLAAVLAVGFRNTSLGYDGSYALAWGADLVHGRRVQYDVLFAPTPHPLAVAMGGLASLFGGADEAVLFGVEIVSVAAFAVGIYRLGAIAIGPLVGLIACTIVLSRVAFVEFGVQGTADVPALALIVWAAVLEARQRQRGTPVLILLALAGLMRPEAWLLSAAYWLWIAPSSTPRRRVEAAVVVASAPVVWGLTDALVTGDPLWSLHGTQEFGAQLERLTGLADLPQASATALRDTLGFPVLVSAALGLGGCVLWLRTRAMVPLVLLGANAITFLLLALAGLPLVARYLFTGCAMLALFAAAGVAGWTALSPGPRRRTWATAGVACGLVMFLSLPSAVRALRIERVELAQKDAVIDDLRALADSPPTSIALRRCARLYLPTSRYFPIVGHASGREYTVLASARLERPSASGALVLPVTASAERILAYRPDPGRLAVAAPVSYRLVGRNRSFAVLAGPMCTA